MDDPTITTIGEQLESLVDDQSPPKLVLDMANMPYISSAMIRVLMTTSRRAQDRSGELRLAGVAEPVREVLRIARLDLILKVFDTRNEAMAAF